MTKRAPKDIVTDTKLFTAAMHIRQYLCDLSGLIPRLNEDPNPYYGATDDGLTLTEYYGGPSCVGTPLGNWAATGGGCHDEAWREIAIERLGLKLLVPETVTDNGVFGPVWEITKDLDGNTLPRVSNIPVTMFSGVEYEDTLKLGNFAVPEMVAELEASGEECEWGPDNSEPLTHPTRTPRQVYGSIRYLYSRMLWGRLKKQIDFIAWDDRVDDEFFLQPIYSGSAKDLEEEVKELRLSPRILAMCDIDSRSYLLKSESSGLLAWVRTKYKSGTGYTVDIVAYADAHDPTQEEIALLAKLLKPRTAVISEDFTNPDGRD